jgi:hypothetical protein
MREPCPRGCIAPQGSPSLHECPALELVLSGDGFTSTLRCRRCCGLILRKERDDGSSRHVNVLGGARLDPGSRTPHHHVWGEYLVCERGLLSLSRFMVYCASTERRHPYGRCTVR